MKLSIFSGERPNVSPHNLSDNQATLCRDCYLQSSGLDPLRSALQTATGYAGAKTIYKAGSKFIQMSQWTDFVRSPIVKDAFERVYFTPESGGLRVVGWGALGDNVAGVNLSALKGPDGVVDVVKTRGGTFIIHGFTVTFLYENFENLSGNGMPNEYTMADTPVYVEYKEGADNLIIRWNNKSTGIVGVNIYAQEGVVFYLQKSVSRSTDQVELDNFVIDKTTPVAINATGAGTYTSVEVVIDDSNNKDAAFLITYVSGRDEETRPSRASSIVSYDDGVDKVELTLPVSGNADVVTKRVYMEIEGTWFLLAEVPNAQATLTVDPLDDDIAQRYAADVAAGNVDSLIGSELTTESYFHAPDDLKGLIGLPNGCLAGFTYDDGGQVAGTVHISVPYQGHAWPLEYRFKVGYKPVALLAVPEGVLVLTKGQHTLISGSTPDVMRDQVLHSQQSCVDKRGVLSIGGVGVWVSPDGLSAYGGGQVNVISRDVWSKKQWEGLNPASMLLGQYEGRLLIYPQGNTEGILYDMGRHDMTRLSQGGATALLYDVEEDILHQVRAGNLEQFNAGDAMQAEWISRPYVVPGARAYSSMRLEVEGDTQVSLYKGDNALILADAQAVSFWTKLINHINVFRVGSSGRKRSVRVGFRLIGAKRLRLAQLARDMREIS